MSNESKLQIITGIAQMQDTSNSYRLNGSVITFVPTMGYLHEGHLSLIREAKASGDVVVASIFVNPTQFGPAEDYKEYTRDMEGDIKKLETQGVDILFAPEAGDIYPDGYQTYLNVTELEKPLCGKFREGHFRGVATVVLKLFNIVMPHKAFFGRKDYQQLRVIEAMVGDLNLNIEIFGLPIVREESGLALSSRNAYLSKSEHSRAQSVSRALFAIKDRFEAGITKVEQLVSVGRAILHEAKIDEIDYLEICDPETLGSRTEAREGDYVGIAVHVGKARLIDNIIL